LEVLLQSYLGREQVEPGRRGVIDDPGVRPNPSERQEYGQVASGHDNHDRGDPGDQMESERKAQDERHHPEDDQRERADAPVGANRHRDRRGGEGTEPIGLDTESNVSWWNADHEHSEAVEPFMGKEPRGQQQEVETSSLATARPQSSRWTDVPPTIITRARPATIP
jgi:hypothetical protein